MKETQTHSAQTDQPWGWVITAAVFGSNALSVGYYRAFGVFFVEILSSFRSSTSTTSLIMGVQSAVLSLSALVVHSVVLPVTGERRSALLGGVLMAVGMMITTFATSIPFLIFSLSVLVGLGNAMTYGPSLVLLGQYFERRRAVAMAVATSGSSVGSMTLPLLATHLLHTYGLRGAWLLYGAVTLHLCVFASLYRPLGQQQQQQKGKEGSEDDVESSSAGALLGDSKQCRGDGQSVKMDPEALDVGSLRTDAGLPGRVVDKEEEGEGGVVAGGKEPLFVRGGEAGDVLGDARKQNDAYLVAERYRKYLGEGGDTAKPFCSAEDMSSSSSSSFFFFPRGSGRPPARGDLHGKRSSTVGDLRCPSPHHPRHPLHPHSGSSATDGTSLLQRRLERESIHSSHPYLLVPSPSLTLLTQEEADAPSSTSSSSSTTCEGRGCRGVWSKVSCGGDLLRRPVFWLIQAYVCLGVVGATGAGVYLPALCGERGLSPGDTAVVLTVWGALNLVGRLLFGVLADRQWLGPCHISALAFLGIGLLFQLLPVLPSSLGVMVGVAAVYGVLEGAYFSMLPLIIIHLLSLRHFSRTLGFVQLSQGAFATLSYPVLGRLKDLTGNYNATFQCLGACALMASVLLLLESGVRALKSRRSSADCDCSQNL
ncbi:uncharacterized protein LOC143296142 [Babylonia areolata]|uniref:uncharacterized protein LOC143296142 n=1 Tax=Babylonia areolata TaxID=304850 RepID=UPI003FD0C215